MIGINLYQNEEPKMIEKPQNLSICQKKCVWTKKIASNADKLVE